MDLPLIRGHVPTRGPLTPAMLHELEELLPGYLPRQRWFGGKARELAGVRILDAIRCVAREVDAHLLVLEVSYADGERSRYTLPVMTADATDPILFEAPHAVLGRVADGNEEGGCLFYDATRNPAFGAYVLDWIGAERSLDGLTCQIVGERMATYGDLTSEPGERLDVTITAGEQSNTSMVLGGRLILKLYRRLEAGESAELEIGRFLTERTSFTGTPSVAGALTLRRADGEPATVAVLHEFVPNHGDAWTYTLDAVRRFFATAATDPLEASGWRMRPSRPMSLAEESLPESLVAAVGDFLADARILGQRTGQMHLALASQPDEPSFAPEPFSVTDRKAALDAAHSLVRRVLPAARSALVHLDRMRGARLSAVVEQETALRLRFHQIWGRELRAQRIRCHGDYHLGQILRLDHDFTIIDFEGEPARSIAARKRKDSPLRDVAGLLRSFHYAAHAELVWSGAEDSKPENNPLTSLAEAWYGAVVSAFLRSYLDTCAGADFLPRSSSDLADLLDAYLLEKAVYEIGYELNHRPEWVGIPVAGLLQLLA